MKDVCNNYIRICPRCGMMSLVNDSCSICAAEMIETTETLFSAADKGFTSTIEAIEGLAKESEKYDRKAWKLRKKTVRNQLLSDLKERRKTKKEKGISIEENLITTMTEIASAGQTRFNQPSLIFAMERAMSEIDNAQDALSFGILSYLKMRTELINAEYPNSEKAKSLNNLTGETIDVINSLYLAGQQEGVNAINLLLFESIGMEEKRSL